MLVPGKLILVVWHGHCSNTQLEYEAEEDYLLKSNDKRST